MRNKMTKMSADEFLMVTMRGLKILTMTIKIYHEYEGTSSGKLELKIWLPGGRFLIHGVHI